MARLRKKGVSIGTDAIVLPGSVVVTNVELGDGTWIGYNCVLRGKAPILIGKHCEFGEGVNIHSSNHELNRANLNVRFQLQFAEEFPDVRAPVKIGHNVWIGNGATILAGVTVGDGAVIGASSVVTHDIPPFGVVVGSPARLIRKRFTEEVIAELLAIAWWDWTKEQVEEGRELFMADLTSEDAVSLLRNFR